MITSSWNSLSSVSITNCFRKAGFINTSEQSAEGLDEEEDWKKVTSDPKIQSKDFVRCDYDLFMTARMAIGEICSA
jgi:hypothetical protein